MSSERDLLDKLFTALGQRDANTMAECYHDEATFEDIAFSLEGKDHIAAMWRFVCHNDTLTSSYKILHVDAERALVEVVDDYLLSADEKKDKKQTNTKPPVRRPVHNVIRSTFKFDSDNGLIRTQKDDCSALRWGVQALGFFKGIGSWLLPPLRRCKASNKLLDFLIKHPIPAEPN